jgi:hypothetical protein
VKNIARLMLFFTICFVALFLLAAVFRYLQIRIDEIRIIPAQSGAGLGDFIAASRRGLSFSLYCSILLALNYAARRRMAKFMTIIWLFILACGAVTGVSLGIIRLGAMTALPNSSPVPLGAPGLMLSQGDTTIVLLDDPQAARGSRVVSMPGRPLLYQEVPTGPDNTVAGLPLIPFKNEPDYFLNSILLDFSLSSWQFDLRFGQGLIPFGIYAGSLILLLVSLGFIMEMSRWPLANLFFGALVFRGVLALENLINEDTILNLTGSFLGARITPDLVSPLIFTTLALLVILYTILAHLARSRREQDG